VPAHRRRARRAQSLFVLARDDRTRFADLYAALAGELLRYFGRRTRSVNDAYDLMAETFAELFARIDAWDGSTDAQGRAWMWAIARSRLFDFYERGRIESRYADRIGLHPPTLGDEDYERIEELIDLDGARGIMRAALARLPPDDQEVLRLRVIEEQPFSDVACALAITEEAARKRASRARRRLIAEFDRLDASGAPTAAGGS
jgi:RNA polymerase sigma-70 factor (ECF subfamily)